MKNSKKIRKTLINFEKIQEIQNMNNSKKISKKPKISRKIEKFPQK